MKKEVIENTNLKIVNLNRDTMLAAAIFLKQEVVNLGVTRWK